MVTANGDTQWGAPSKVFWVSMRVKIKRWRVYNEDSVYKMLIELNKLAEECIAEMRENQEMELTTADKMNLCNSKNAAFVIVNLSPKM